MGEMYTAEKIKGEGGHLFSWDMGLTENLAQYYILSQSQVTGTMHGAMNETLYKQRVTPLPQPPCTVILSYKYNETKRLVSRSLNPEYLCIHIHT